MARACGGQPCPEAQGSVAVTGPGCQGGARAGDLGSVELGHPLRQDPLGLVAARSPGQPLVSLQILGLTFAMTMYCQVVKADTYCA